jgi:oxepin-CoA hydrolase/3-oxo-5,6-dehydrosuberyl-CoA semialdehyde dehydrogenase
VKEVVREMTVKAGQKCTAIRKALVPAAMAGDVVSALQTALQKIVVGDPRCEGVRMGPLVSQEQRTDVLARSPICSREADVVAGSMDHFEVQGADRARGAFVPPLLLLCRDPKTARAIHEVEAFGPVATVVPYRDTADAIALARRGGGSLAASVFCADDALASQIVLGLAPYHGRILVVNQSCAKESTGHGSPLAPLDSRRSGPRRRRRGDGRHSRGIALHATHGRAGLARHHYGRPAGAGCGAAGYGIRAGIRFEFPSTIWSWAIR